MADKYASFQELERGERRGVYGVRSCLRRATIAVIAPHGGSIEPGTSEIARKHCRGRPRRNTWSPPRETQEQLDKMKLPL
jgi:phage replication-related protein YjqB (UPF0714/DUF867 family)